MEVNRSTSTLHPIARQVSPGIMLLIPRYQSVVKLPGGTFWVLPQPICSQLIDVIGKGFLVVVFGERVSEGSFHGPGREPPGWRWFGDLSKSVVVVPG